jgi:epoxyqueuosine reductase
MENLLRQAGACAVGCVAAQRLRQHMSEDAWARAEQNTPGLKRLLCAAFPYGPERPTPGKLSLYARGTDYHQVLRERLAPVVEALSCKYLGCRFDFYADVSPFPEVYAAALAGLGKLGQNGLLIVPGAGSFVFLGFLATDAELPETGGEIVPCRGCGACKKACPGGALGEGLDQSRCLSALTQQRGSLTDEQTALIKRGGMLWGCDRCQLACPENQSRTAPPLPEFAPLPDPTEAELQLSDRAFRRTFEGRAFTWRGVQPLRRNCEILKE